MSCWEHGNNAVQKPQDPDAEKPNWSDEPMTLDELLGKNKDDE